jgi:hypothetical protein
MQAMSRLRERTAWTLAAALAALVIAIFVGVIEGGPLDPPGPPAPTDSVRLPGTPISSVPINITAPGHYYLTRDLSFVTPGTAILITSDDVNLNLNGFTVRGGANVGISISGARTRTHIHKGTVKQFSVGIQQAVDAASTTVTIEDMIVTDTSGIAVSVQENAAVRRVTVARSGGAGLIAGQHSSIEDARVSETVNFGIDAGLNSAVRNCNVSQVSGGAAGQAAVRVGNDSTVERCLVSSNQSAGIRGGNGVLVSHALSQFNTGGDAIGIIVGASSAVLDSSSRANGSTGIVAGNFSIVENSASNLNDASGISIGARGIVRGCTMESNDVDGIAAVNSAGAVIESNVIVGNGNDGIESGTGVRILNNTLRGNGAATMGTADGAAINMASTISHVEGNLIIGNDVGILSTSGNNTIVRNVARDNLGGNYQVQPDDLDGVIITIANVGTDTHSHYNYAP